LGISGSVEALHHFQQARGDRLIAKAIVHGAQAQPDDSDRCRFRAWEDLDGAVIPLGIQIAFKVHLSGPNSRETSTGPRITLEVSSQNGDCEGRFQLGRRFFVFRLGETGTFGYSSACSRPTFHGPSAVIKERQLRQELSTLEQRLSLLDRQLADALHRIHHSTSADLIEKATQDEKTYLAQLDRLMTRMRAIEGQLLQIDKQATRH